MEPAADLPGPERVTAAREALAVVEALLAEMRPKRRAAFVLHVLEGYSMEEVAAILNASIAAVKVRVHDARRRIEKRLKRCPELRRRVAGAGRARDRDGCTEVESRLVDADRRRLDPGGQRAPAAHLEGCAGCRERAALWRGLVPGMRQPSPAAPDAMARGACRSRSTASWPGEAPPPAGAGRRWDGYRRRRSVWRRPRLVALWLRPAAPAHRWVVARSARRARGRRPPTGARRPGSARAPSWRSRRARQTALQRGTARLAIDGPAHLVLEGGARDVNIRLLDGKLQAAVSHRTTTNRSRS